MLAQPLARSLNILVGRMWKTGPAEVPFTRMNTHQLILPFHTSRGKVQGSFGVASPGICRRRMLDMRLLVKNLYRLAATARHQSHDSDNYQEQHAQNEGNPATMNPSASATTLFINILIHKSMSVSAIFAHAVASCIAL